MNQLQEAFVTAVQRSPKVSQLDEFTTEYKAFKAGNGIRTALPSSMKQKAAAMIKSGIKRSKLAEALGISQSAIIAWEKDVGGVSTKPQKTKTPEKTISLVTPSPMQLSTSSQGITVEVAGVKVNLNGPKDKVMALLNRLVD